MTTYSQLDSRWANIKLGTSNVTIGGYGCALTSVGMILDTTPDLVNKRLIEVGGYSQGNLIIWDKVREAYPTKVESVRRVWSYNNDDVKANVPCVVQVDGSPIGAPTHFVVYKGNQQLVDPWGGVVRPTYTYVPVSYCVIKLKQTSEAPNADSKIKTALDALTIANSAIVAAKQIGDPQYTTKILPVIQKLKEATGNIR